jgi:putative transcriptional regulator
MIANNIKTYREIANLSQEECSKRLDVTRTYLSKLENQKHSPSPELMEKACDLFNQPLSTLFYILKKDTE